MILLLLACGDVRGVSAYQDCMSCHPDHQAELGASAHGAGTSTLFDALQAEADAELGVPGLCDGCHRPEQGVECTTCHAAMGTHGIGSGSLIVDLRGVVLGGDEVEDRAPHATAPGGLLGDSALCGTCHQVELVGGFVERPYSAWEESPAAAEGVHCQDCHLPEVDGRRSHRFQGVGDGSEAALDLLWRGVSGHWEGDTLVLTNLTGHRYPDGMAAVRELWLTTDTGTSIPLHPELVGPDGPVASPVLADARVERGLAPGEVKALHLPDAGRVCLTYRSRAEVLTRHLGLETEPLLTVGCFERPTR